jgi:hypothetical protein
MVAAAYLSCMTERAAVVVVMIGVATMPIPVMCPASVRVPPSRPITPVPRAVPCVPCVRPEPIVDDRTIDVNRLYHVVRTIDILVAYYLNGYLVMLVFLYIYRGYVLEDILRQHRLQNDQTLVTLAGLYDTKIIDLPVAVQIQVTERTVRVVEHRLELLQVLSLCEQFSYNLQIESFRDVGTLSGNSNCLFRP